jgi:hypothetical protein
MHELYLKSLLEQQVKTSAIAAARETLKTKHENVIFFL